ncbi:mitochondrial 54S ribosomal protein rml2 [Neophaeococcomyces mojaviensis]|uniref:Mitochondrial 54S ribosomal protein rml2 n=1 Tax=Neophaeococcomyces mojaviensis TaxID=3383035 RepID=A0ACC3A0B7_9EURO|nr:mitochondrial 54S ribosomal protein rml2 [Knufia sp. JES_112]
MLQPRLSLRQVGIRYQTLSNVVRRSYTQVADPIAPSRSKEESTVNTPASQPQDRAVQTTNETALRKYTPRTPGVRHLVRPRNDHLWKGRPLFALTFPKKGQSRGGRNKTGQITVRHRGGGAKRRIRIVDFKRADPGKHFVERIEHDPNRSAHIALVKNFKTGKQSYILAAEGMRAGDVVESYRSGLPDDLLKSMGGSVDMGVIASKTAWRGNCLKLGMIPVGTPIFNIAPYADSYGKFARSAGTHGIIIGKGEDTVQKEMIKAMGEDSKLDLSTLSREQLQRFEKAANYVTVRLSSGEIRLFDKEAVATIGVASNANFKYTSLGKAGRKRWLGIRPTVRGTAMNTVDHPHGGGRGKSKGNKIPVSPWGVPTKSGYKTRPRDKVNKLIVQERPRNQGKRRRGYA